MATALASSVVLGERPHRAAPPSAQSPEAGPPGASRTLRERAGASPPQWERPGLTVLVARVEHAETDVVSLGEDDLPPSLRSRTALLLLRRQADKRDKRLVLVSQGRDLTRLARLAGLEIASAPGWPASPAVQAASPSGQAASPSGRGDGRRPETGTGAIGGHPMERPVRVETGVRRVAVEGPRRPAFAPPPVAVGTLPPPGARTGGAAAWPNRRGPVPGAERSSPVWGMFAGGPPGADTLDRRAPAWTSAALERGRHRPAARSSLVASGAAALWRQVAAQRIDVARWGAIAAAGLAVMGMLLALLPSATVTLTPVSEAWQFDVPIVVDPALKQPDVARGRLPGRAISKEVVESQQWPTTGRKIVPDARAAGEVVFINKTDKAVTVPKGAVVVAGNIRFTTQSEVGVPGTAFSGPQQRIAIARVAVQAAAAGAAGNVDKYQINRIEGPLATTLEVQNDMPTRGGSDRPISFVTAEDRNNVQAALQRTLAERLMQQVKAQLPTGGTDILVPWAGQNPAVVEATFNKNVDDEAQTLTLTLKMRYGATVFSHAALTSLVEQVARKKLLEARPGFALARGTLKVQPPDVGPADGGAVPLTARASGTILAQFDARQVRSALVNRPMGQARSYLGTIPGAAAYDLRVWPAWFGRLPVLGWRISVRTGAAQVAGAG